MSRENLIPKKIHYCWFGGNPLPEMARKCIESWKEFCPDYEIVEWNENNFDLKYCDYVREAYDAKKWAFVSDVARLYALVKEGGVYMDTDVEVLKPLDTILQNEAVSGFEAVDRVPTGLMACRAGHPLFQELLGDYAGAHFLREDGSYDLTTNVTRITNTCLKYGLKLDGQKQTVHGFTLYPKDYFAAKDCETGKTTITENTYTIHHYDGSWQTEEMKTISAYTQKLREFLPSTVAGYAATFLATVRHHGMRAAIQKLVCWIQQRINKKDM